MRSFEVIMPEANCPCSRDQPKRHRAAPIQSGSVCFPIISFHDLKDGPETVRVPWGVSPVRENCASRPESTGGWIFQAWFVARTLVPDGLDQSPARWTAYLQQQVGQDSLIAFSTTSRVSPVSF